MLDLLIVSIQQFSRKSSTDRVLDLSFSSVVYPIYHNLASFAVVVLDPFPEGKSPCGDQNVNTQRYSLDCHPNTLCQWSLNFTVVGGP